MQLLSTVATAAVLFAVTDLDDLLVLLAFFSDPRARARHVVFGQFLGMAVIYLASVAASLAAFVIPRGFVGLLGLVPLVMGAVGLARLLMAHRGGDLERTAIGVPLLSQSRGLVAVALVTMANGGDNVAAYTPVLALHGWADKGLFGLVFFGMTGLWCAIAHLASRRGALLPGITRIGRLALPLVLIGLGAAILWRNGGAAMIGGS